MKKTILGLTLIGCLSLSFANDGEQSKNNKVSQEEKQVKIQERKSKILERINEIGKVYNSKRRKIIHKPKTKYSETLKELILKAL